MRNDCILARLGSEYLYLTVTMTAMTMMMTRKTPTTRLMMRVRWLLGLEGGALITVSVVVEEVLTIVLELLGLGVLLVAGDGEEVDVVDVEVEV